MTGVQTCALPILALRYSCESHSSLVASNTARLAAICETVKERAKTLVELVERARFYFEPPAAYEPKAAQRFLTPEGARRLDRLCAGLGAEPEWTPAALERAYRALTEELGLELVDLAQLSRLALTGGTASPPLFDVLGLLGREEALARLRRARAAAGGTP